jgi:hypothetical protein
MSERCVTLGMLRLVRLWRYLDGRGEAVVEAKPVGDDNRAILRSQTAWVT